MTGSEIYRLIQQTASWADEIGKMAARAESKENEGQPIEIKFSGAALRSLESVLIAAEDVISKTEFTIAKMDEWEKGCVDPLTTEEWQEWSDRVRAAMKKDKEGENVKGCTDQ